MLRVRNKNVYDEKYSGLFVEPESQKTQRISTKSLSCHSLDYSILKKIFAIQKTDLFQKKFTISSSV